MPRSPPKSAASSPSSLPRAPGRPGAASDRFALAPAVSDALPSWVEALGHEDAGLRILVQPRASRSRITGEHDGLLKVQLAAPPVDGAANRALLELLVDLLQIPKRQVTLLSGESSRRKRVRVEGVAPADVAARLNPTIPDPSGPV